MERRRGVLKQKEILQFTGNPENKGHPMERQIKVFIDKWSSFGGFFVFI